MHRAKPWWLLSITLLSVIVFLAVIYSPSRESHKQQSADETKQGQRNELKEEGSQSSETSSERGAANDAQGNVPKKENDDDKIKVQSNDSSAAKQSRPDEPDSANAAPFKGDVYSLFGMSIGDEKQLFLRTHGSPLNEYFTDGDSEPLLVLEFTDFIAGFDSEGRAEFINVISENNKVGFGEITIGSPVDEVAQTLGAADSFSTYVMTYTKNGAVLKFDIDPELQTVSSIKLFKQTD